MAAWKNSSKVHSLNIKQVNRTGFFFVNEFKRMLYYSASKAIHNFEELLLLFEAIEPKKKHKIRTC